ncbi:hypothetical protein LRS04_01355 [Phenylobacterium sp. J367]|nr:hypothetical protein [Phenylobacterium sp. J367]MCR5877169.1 hypothetical protein [Phenylobacterium sp. J367]
MPRSERPSTGSPHERGLGVGGAAEVRIVVDAGGQRQVEPLDERHGVGAGYDRHEELAVGRADLAVVLAVVRGRRRVRGRKDALVLLVAERGVLVGDADGAADLAGRQVEERAVELGLHMLLQRVGLLQAEADDPGIDLVADRAAEDVQRRRRTGIPERDGDGEVVELLGAEAGHRLVVAAGVVGVRLPVGRQVPLDADCALGADLLALALRAGAGQAVLDGQVGVGRHARDAADVERVRRRDAEAAAQRRVLGDDPAPGEEALVPDLDVVADVLADGEEAVQALLARQEIAVHGVVPVRRAGEGRVGQAHAADHDVRDIGLGGPLVRAAVGPQVLGEELAVGAREVAAVVGLQGDEDVARRPGLAERLGQGFLVEAVARAVAGRGLRPVEPAPRDDVDHAGHRVGAVDRRVAVEHDFQPFGGAARDHARVGQRAEHAAGPCGGRSAAAASPPGRGPAG